MLEPSPAPRKLPTEVLPADVRAPGAIRATDPVGGVILERGPSWGVVLGRLFWGGHSVGGL